MCVNIIGSLWGLEDEDGHNWTNGIFLLNEYYGEWGLNYYYDLYSEEGWWAMMGDFVWMSSFIGPLLEPWWILILVAMGDLTFGETGDEDLTEEEIAEKEKKAGANPDADDKAALGLISTDSMKGDARYTPDDH